MTIRAWEDDLVSSEKSLLRKEQKILFAAEEVRFPIFRFLGGFWPAGASERTRNFSWSLKWSCHNRQKAEGATTNNNHNRNRRFCFCLASSPHHPSSSTAGARKADESSTFEYRYGGATGCGSHEMDDSLDDMITAIYHMPILLSDRRRDIWTFFLLPRIIHAGMWRPRSKERIRSLIPTLWWGLEEEREGGSYGDRADHRSSAPFVSKTFLDDVWRDSGIFTNFLWYLHIQPRSLWFHSSWRYVLVGSLTHHLKIEQDEERTIRQRTAAAAAKEKRRRCCLFSLETYQCIVLPHIIRYACN